MNVEGQIYYSERKVYKYLAKEDLRLDLLPKLRRLALTKRTDHPWSTLDDDELLRSANLYLKDYETGEEGYTLAAALLLGRDDVIASVAPAYRTDAYVQLDNVDRYDDREIVKTNLVEAYDALLNFAQKHLPDKFYLEGVQTVSLRDAIVRELISNTLIHREYTSPYPAKFVIDKEGIHTQNASRPRFLGQLTPQSFNPLPKNPIIAEFFVNIGRADTLGSGTRNLFKYSGLYGTAQPVLVEGDVFDALIPMSAPTAKFKAHDVDDVVLRMAKDRGSVTTAEVAEAAQVTPRTALRHISALVKDGLLFPKGGTKSRRYVVTER